MKKSEITPAHEAILHDARIAVVTDALRGWDDTKNSTAWVDFSGLTGVLTTDLEQLTEWGLLERRSQTAGYSEYRLTLRGHTELLRMDTRDLRFYQNANRDGNGG